jgi:hypothetical protein
MIDKMGKDIARRHAEFQARVARYARELSAEMFPEGVPEGMTFSDLERAAVAAGDEVARATIEVRVRTRARSDADRPPEACPECGGPLGEGPGRDRRLATTRGEVAWTETTQRCPRCRRAFSPSRPRAGA